jgi:uncharacterized membrane protein YkoI
MRFHSWLILPAFLIGTAAAQDTEVKVKMRDLPPAVQKAVREQSKGAVLRGLAKEVEKGVTLYEAELKVNGRTRDVSFDTDGKVVSVEEEVPLGSIPPGAQAAIRKSVGAGKLQLVEAVTSGGTVYYEAHIKSGGKTSEIKVDANGSAVR